MADTDKTLSLLMILSIAVFAAAGILSGGVVSAFKGFILLQQHPARLINDFTVAGGVAGALLNASVMGLIGLILVKMNRVRLSGPTIAAIFTIMGFSLFGKTPLNALPILAGVYLAAKIAGKTYRSYIIIALFGTALGPLVTYLVFECGLTGTAALAVGAAGGIAAGLLLPAAAVAILRFHSGYNIYNIGYTSGFIGLFATSFLVASRKDVAIEVIWNSDPALALILLVPLLSLMFIAFGTALEGKELINNLKKLLKLTGQLPSDFMEMVTPGAALVNAGIMGLLGSLYLFVVGADFNGPTIGGLMTVVGFSTFGKHPRNCWSIAVGVIFATLLFGKSLTAPGPVLALLFGTTLAPLAGEFGPLVGIAAGFTHLVMVERTAAWHGGLDLYNNGFAGGLTASLFISIIDWIKTNLPKKREKGRQKA